MSDSNQHQNTEQAEAKAAKPRRPQDSVSRVSEIDKTTYLLLRMFAKTYKTITIKFDRLAVFVKQYAERYSSQYKQVAYFLQDPATKLKQHLQVLEKQRQCELVSKGETIELIRFPNYLYSLIRKTYEDIEKNPGFPFPTEESLGFEFPQDKITSVDVKSGLMEFLKKPQSKTQPIIRLTFPEGRLNFIITQDLITQNLLTISVGKVRLYLNSSNNVSYVQSRLQSTFNVNQTSLKEIINTITTRPEMAVNSVLEASDFTFRFWGYLNHHIEKEFKDKPNPLANENTYIQASRLIGVFNVFHREHAQKKSGDQDTAVKTVEALFQKPPYVFTVAEIYGLKNKSGAALFNKDTAEKLNQFLAVKTKTKGKETLPEILRLKTPGKKEYYVHRDQSASIFLKKLSETTAELEDYYIDTLKGSREGGQSIDSLGDDQAFQTDVLRRVQAYYPLFSSFLNYSLLRSLVVETKIGADSIKTIEGCFDGSKEKLKPLCEILGLDWKELQKEIREQMPLWERMTFLRKLAGAFGKLFQKAKNDARTNMTASSSKRSKPASRSKSQARTSSSSAKKSQGSEKPQQQTASDKRAAYREALIALKEQFVGKSVTIPEKLEELIEKWNPIFDVQARKNLVLDVNSMVRDFLRGLKRGFRVKPPDADRLRSLAHKLAQNKAFERIKNRDLFQRYLEIYMIKLMGEK